MFFLYVLSLLHTQHKHNIPPIGLLDGIHINYVVFHSPLHTLLMYDWLGL